MSTAVMTVLGPVAPERLGITDAHSHLWIDAVHGADPMAPVLNDEAAIAGELRAFRAAGGGSIVDCQPGGCGRDGRVLRRLSRAAGVHVVACTGFHRRIYYGDAAPLWSAGTDQAARLFVDELCTGLAETRAEANPVRAGFIKIAGEAGLDATPRHLLEAAAAAALETGCAIEMHTERGSAVEDFLRFFVDQGLSPTRLVFCHVDKRPDFALHREMADSGALLEYDTFFRPKYEPERHVWPLLRQMLSAGLGRQVALATDMADPALWQSLGGGPGPGAFVTAIGARLEQWLIAAPLIAAVMGGNIAHRLAIHENE